VNTVRDYADAADPWAEPVDFSEPVRPPFPVEVLPDWLGGFVESVACATQTPKDLAGCLSLAAASAAIARRFEIHPRSDWREPANIYSATVLPPGHRKSAVFSLVQAPMIEAEREACGIAEPVIAAAEARHEHLAGRIKRAQSGVAKMAGVEADEALREIARLKTELRSMRVPARPQYTVDDCTPERLQTLLAAQGERLAVFSAEGDVFELMAGRYSSNGAPNLGVYLKAHSGDELRVDRVGRPPEYLHKPALTIGLAIQPDVLRAIQSKPGFRGRGLLGRILYSLPIDALGSRDPDPDPMPDGMNALYSRRLRSLWLLPTRHDERGEIVATPLTFSLPARHAITAFLREIEPRLGGDGDLHPFTDWAGKLAGATVRLAGVLHMADLAGKGDAPACEIQAPTVERGIVLGRYFLAHAIVAFRVMRVDEAADDAGDLLAWIRRQAVDGVATFSKRDAHYARKHRFAKADDLDPALDFLEQHGWIRPVLGTQPKRGGRPASPRFEIHPRGAR
jgi:hypothetical protein